MDGDAVKSIEGFIQEELDLVQAEVLAADTFEGLVMGWIKQWRELLLEDVGKWQATL